MTLTDENYYGSEANKRYLSVSQYKDFAGTYGKTGCEHHAMEKLNGRWADEVTTPLLVGSYVDTYIEGPESFERFCGQHPEMFKQDGTLKETYAVGRRVLERIGRDAYFCNALSGDKQTIMTGKLFGAEWKIKMDSYLKHEAIVDLKVVKSLREHKWVKDLGYLSFIEYWGYDVQGAVYQEIVRQNTGEKLPFFIAAASKEKYPDIAVINIPQVKLDEALYKVEMHMPRIIKVKSGEEEPLRCEECDCCKNSRVLSHWIYEDELLGIG